MRLVSGPKIRKIGKVNTVLYVCVERGNKIPDEVQRQTEEAIKYMRETDMRWKHVATFYDKDCCIDDPNRQGLQSALRMVKEGCARREWWGIMVVHERFLDGRWNGLERWFQNHHKYGMEICITESVVNTLSWEGMLYAIGSFNERRLVERALLRLLPEELTEQYELEEKPPMDGGFPVWDRFGTSELKNLLWCNLANNAVYYSALELMAQWRNVPTTLGGIPWVCTIDKQGVPTWVLGMSPYAVLYPGLDTTDAVTACQRAFIQEWKRHHKLT